MAQNEQLDLSHLRINRSEPAQSSTPRSRITLKIGAGVAVIILGIVAYILIGRALDPIIEVRLATASFSSPSQASAILTASGYVVAQRKAAVASKATGRLEYLGVIEGDRVMKNQVLARIENTDIRAQLDQARANLKLNEAELHDATQTLERARQLLEKGLVPQADYDAAEARYRRVLAGIDVAKAAIAGAEVALENTLIRAPFDGTVLTKNADVGEMVAPMAASVGSRSAVVTIADMSSLEVEADVSESNIDRIKPDQPCETILDAYPESRYQGFVSKIVPTADRAKATVMVKVGFRSYDAKVLPEMSAKVLFLTHPPSAQEQSSQPVLTVPASAVAKRNGTNMVYTVRDNIAVENPVQIGRSMGSQVEIVSGISAGTRVIATVSNEIHDGTRVSVK
ncbi:MAG: efflux RND transporter periplasmic adaptor subunit [Ignavibacteriales bacterium]|nr:efflux RND transporter periplasmic adaptor subunit [Ignavibacteriales bacterium]